MPFRASLCHSLVSICLGDGIAEKSCLGDYACLGVKGTPSLYVLYNTMPFHSSLWYSLVSIWLGDIAEKSCLGDKACYYAEGTTPSLYDLYLSAISFQWLTPCATLYTSYRRNHWNWKLVSFSDLDNHYSSFTVVHFLTVSIHIAVTAFDRAVAIPIVRQEYYLICAGKKST